MRLTEGRYRLKVPAGAPGWVLSAVPAAASQHAAACVGRFGKTGEGSAPLPAR